MSTPFLQYHRVSYIAAKDCNETDVATQASSPARRELGGKGKRTIRHIIAEGLRSYDLESLDTSQLCRGRKSHDNDAKAVAEQFSIDRCARIPFQDTDEVRYSTQHRLTTAGDEIFILEVNGEVRATIVIKALDRHLTTCKAARHPTQYIDNFSLKQHTPALRGDEGRDRIFLTLPCFQHHSADGTCLRYRAEYSCAFNLGAAPWGHGIGGMTSHLNGHRACHALQPEGIAHFIEQHDIMPNVAQGGRRRRETVDEKRAHLQLGKGSPHAISIHHRQITQGRRQHRAHGVTATDFFRDERINAPSHMTLQGTHGVEELIPTDDALDTHSWRPHAADRRHQGIIGECQRIDHRNALALLQEFAGVELDGIGIAPTPCTQHISPYLERFQIIRRYVPGDVHSTTFPCFAGCSSALAGGVQREQKCHYSTGAVGMRPVPASHWRALPPFGRAGAALQGG